MLAILSLSLLMNTIGWIQMTSIDFKIMFAYGKEGVTRRMLNYQNWIYMALYLPVSPISVWVIETKGIRHSLIIGLILQLIGFIVRIFINYEFLTLLIGQTFLALGQPFIFNLPSKFSAMWFPKRERVAATMVAYNSAILGFIVGFYLTQGVVYRDITKPDDQSMKKTMNSIRYEILLLTLMMAVIELIILMLALFYFKVNDELGRLKSNSTVEAWSEYDKLSDHDTHKQTMSNLRSTS